MQSPQNIAKTQGKNMIKEKASWNKWIAKKRNEVTKKGKIPTKLYINKQDAMSLCVENGIDIKNYNKLDSFMGLEIVVKKGLRNIRIE